MIVVRLPEPEVLFPAAVLLLLAGTLFAQDGQIVLTRGGETIVLEPYAPNILRVTLSKTHEAALAAPGYGFVASPAAAGWSASQTERPIFISRIASWPASKGRSIPPWDDSASFFPGSTPGAHITLHHARGQEAAGDDRLGAGDSQSEGRHRRSAARPAPD